MENNRFSIRYLSHFEEDLNKIVDYIAFKLHNKTAAMEFIGLIEKAIIERSNSPLSYEDYPSKRKRKHPYYRIYVKNYIVFYVVIDNVMEIRRLIYAKQDLKQQIE